VVLAAVLVLAPGLVADTAATPDVGAVASPDEEGAERAVDLVLERAATANRSVPHEGDLVVVSFSETGPRIARMEVAFGDEGLRIVREGGTEVGRVDGRGFLRSSSTLLQVGGVERIPVALDRLHSKYAAVVGEHLDLDTGPASSVTLKERETGTLREVLYADEATGLIVRRETYGRDGSPVRTVAYIRLRVAEGAPSMPRAAGREVVEHEVASADAAGLRDIGFVIPSSLPGGYDLVMVLDVPGAHVPTLHLIYADGMYSLSVFQQRGRMKPTATAGASELRTPTGGAVWRWPGSEPRRIVWRGEGATFTALADTPTDELLEAIAGLPTDPPPSILSRLDRGLSRVARWISPTDRSDT
jgi:hypothetical protein